MNEATTFKFVAHDTPRETIVKLQQFLIELKKDGLADTIIYNYHNMFKILLTAHTNLFNPDSIRTYLAESTMKNTSKNVFVGRMN